MQMPLRFLDVSLRGGQNGAFQSVRMVSIMRNIAMAALIICAAGTGSAQDQPGPTHAVGGATNLNDAANLPVERIGRNDLIGITVYDSPELTRTVRVDYDGDIRLPMLQKHIRAAGLYPEDLENAIRAALIEGQVLVDPVVTVSIVEYRSRPINVVGEVKNPGTFQAAGEMTLLDAVSQAGGLTDNAGAEILVSQPQLTPDGKSTELVQRVSVHSLFDSGDPPMNMKLHGGEEIRVPAAGRFYVVGDVKTPGVFPIKDGSESSVLKALALAQGLDRFPQRNAYIYRTEGNNGVKSEIPVKLKKIMNRKSPDVALLANDILYIPVAGGRKATFTAIDRAIMVSASMASVLVLTTQ